MTMDPTTFRRVLGEVPTAVSVISVVDAAGTDRGMTVGAFTSLSLRPPLVLVCIGNDATIAEAIAGATHFGISVLGAGQQELSERFADRELREFGDLPLHRGPAGTALLEGTVARIECRVVARHPGGDHTIVVGEVQLAERSGGAPLVHHRGGYGHVER